MPLVPNNSFSTASPTPSQVQTPFVSSLQSLLSANETDAIIHDLGFAQTRQVLSEAIAARMNGLSNDIAAGVHPRPGLSWKFGNVAPKAEVTPNDPRFTPEQFKKRGFESVTTVLNTFKKNRDRETLEERVLSPLVQQLEEAGFTKVRFSRDEAKVDGEMQEILSLHVDLPNS